MQRLARRRGPGPASADIVSASARARSAACGPPHRELDRSADEGGDGDEDDQRDDLVGVGDRQRVDRLDEEVVDQQRRGDRRDHADDDAADQRDHDDGEQVERGPGRRARAARRARRSSRVSSGSAMTARARPVSWRRRLRPSSRASRLRRRVVEQVLAADVPTVISALTASTQGTLVTVTDGSNRSRPFRRSAVWLWSRCCHQCSTTYSGMTTEITSPGCSRAAGARSAAPAGPSRGTATRSRPAAPGRRARRHSRGSASPCSSAATVNRAQAGRVGRLARRRAPAASGPAGSRPGRPCGSAPAARPRPPSARAGRRGWR